MAKIEEIPKKNKLPDIFDLVLAGQLLGYNEDYLRKQSIAGNFPGYQIFPARGAEWRVNKDDLIEWLEEKRSKSKYQESRKISSQKNV